METTSIPRFRRVRRLVQWVRSNKVSSRLPADSERCFFNEKNPVDVSRSLVRYAACVGELGDELEALVQPDELFEYLLLLHRRSVPIKDSLLDRLTPPLLVRLSCRTGRLSERHEARIVEESHVVSYAENVGVIPSHMEDRIVSPDLIMRYLKFLRRDFRDVPERMLRAMVGQNRHFIQLSGFVGGRLPQYLEESISDPEVAYKYAAGVLKGRLPEGVESCLARKPYWAVQYAFEVIRGMSNPRLPDHLHNALSLIVGEDEREVKRYFAEVDRFPKESA